MVYMCAMQAQRLAHRAQLDALLLSLATKSSRGGRSAALAAHRASRSSEARALKTSRAADAQARSFRCQVRAHRKKRIARAAEISALMAALGGALLGADEEVGASLCPATVKPAAPTDA